MKTTLNLDDAVMQRVRAEARRQGRTMTEIVETALRLFLRRPRRAPGLPALPSFSGGPFLVDIADREALYRAMEAR